MIKVANIEKEKEFCIPKDIHVCVNIYQDGEKWMMTSWLVNGGCEEELNTKDISDVFDTDMPEEAITAIMEAFIHEHEEYIIEMAHWNGE